MGCRRLTQKPGYVRCECQGDVRIVPVGLCSVLSAQMLASSESKTAMSPQADPSMRSEELVSRIGERLVGIIESATGVEIEGAEAKFDMLPLNALTAVEVLSNLDEIADQIVKRGKESERWFCTLAGTAELQAIMRTVREWVQEASQPEGEFRLLDRHAQGLGRHRAGWPAVVDQLRSAASGGILLDDFVEQSFLYQAGDRKPHGEPWIGILHHPPETPDWLSHSRIDRLLLSEPWRDSLRYLRGLVCLSDHLAADVRQRLSHVPVTVIRHPTPTDVSQWRGGNTLLQVGHTFRNTRLIHQFPPCHGWQKIRLLGTDGWVLKHDQTCMSQAVRPVVDTEVVDLSRQHDHEYDRLLSESVAVCEVLAASANNVIVECIARAVPIAVNRHPAVVEYLGEAYPLYYDDPRDIPGLLADSKLQETHVHLKELQQAHWLQVSTFVEQVAMFVDHCTKLEPQPRPQE